MVRGVCRAKLSSADEVWLPTTTTPAPPELGSRTAMRSGLVRKGRGASASTCSMPPSRPSIPSLASRPEDEEEAEDAARPLSFSSDRSSPSCAYTHAHTHDMKKGRRR